MLVLSQLSYGPEASQSSDEVEVVRPVDAESLVVPCRRQAKLDRPSAWKLLDREEPAAVKIHAVGSKGVYLVG